MHLLAAQPGAVNDGTEPVDPGQSPADVIFLSAADTDLAALSAARAAMADPPGLRLANMGWLSHPFTVDTYIEQTCLGARLVVARVLGGVGYFRYALEQLSARLGAAGISLALLPGCDRPDEELFALSTVSRADWEALGAYLREGGPANAAAFLEFCAHLIGQGPRPAAAQPLLRAGCWWPGQGVTGPDDLRGHWQAEAPVVALVFYRALLAGAGLDPVTQMVAALQARGLNPLPVFVASLKDPVSIATLEGIFAAAPPDLVLNATSFAVSSPDPAQWQGARPDTVLDAPGAPVLQIVLSGGGREAWADSARGLAARDVAMNVALPEIDGRILSRAISFKDEAWHDAATECRIAAYRGDAGRVAFVAELAANWVALARARPAERRVALVLANYPNRDGRLANGVGLDTPEATVAVLGALAAAGYRVTDPPTDSAALMAAVFAGPSSWRTDRVSRRGGVRLALQDYLDWYRTLPAAARARIEARWGAPAEDPFVEHGAFALPVLEHGNVVVALQPARGYHIDPEETYHAPDLVPPHGYLAFYLWLRGSFGAHAIVHMGKHGNLEWLPGKALALSEDCFPEIALGPVPHVYPFIVNDPGEGTQAKRRAAAVIVDHLTPPLTRAESYGPLRALEALVDEYYQAAGVDARRITHLRREILSMVSATGLDQDAGLAGLGDDDARLARLDAYLCELKESQIRDGLHVFGRAPAGRLARDLILALARVPRGAGRGGDASLQRALAADLGLGFDPLDCDMAAAWSGPRPRELSGQDPWRTAGDTVERLEDLAARLVELPAAAPGPASAAVMAEIAGRIRPAVEGAGAAEMAGLLRALEGRFLAPGPSGAPTRGRLDVLPTGRNFFSVDSRALPTRTAWALGWKSAALLVEDYLQRQGDWPRAMALSAWGTSNMRTGGDDVAQALALMGVKPVWEEMSGRVTGFEIIPLSALGRPRVDVTLRVSGFFRDAFPAQMDLVDSAARAVMALEEPEAENPAAARFRAEAAETGADRAGARVFGAAPGGYGAGLQAMLEDGLWRDRDDLAESFLDWGGHAYGGGAEGRAARADFARRLGQAEAVVQNQDNHEHDLLDSDDYYQFEGGMAATVEALRGAAPVSYHPDHSRPETPRIRTLDEEIARVVRARAANPKWIAGAMRHGYKGAAEMAATVDYLFAFAATTGAVKGHHFDLVFEAYLGDDTVRDFLEAANGPALREMAARFGEAMERGMWVPRSNSARGVVEGMQDGRGAAPEPRSENEITFRK
ncbi:cobaltochelatase subunit CobN [Mangrovicoccus algicola]|uniref:Cobaltochelatase subunit CobN n=1 Tax=Mangrovicoccus algicola TaxID=2771008 RepID=A0A8J7CJ35_9RHOB|nr:cobaltochelatase subunit CobN [Mangrovicoccus algicola]MBE3637231.1 cobaltochelatase subunit CobN [Mangrovicoccus algicola]